MTNLEVWHSVALPEAFDSDAVNNLILKCGKILKIRKPKAKGKKPTVEVWIISANEIPSAESIVHQAAADLMLRRIILEKSDKKIQELSKTILEKASGR